MHSGVVPKKKPKGKTLHEIEQEEGGPVKESMVGMAAVQRAIRRKKAEAGVWAQTGRGISGGVIICQRPGSSPSRMHVRRKPAADR